MGNICLNNTGTIIYFYFLLYQAEERQKTLKCAADAYFGVCLHIFTNSFNSGQTENFVVFAFFIVVLAFFIRKVVVSAFMISKLPNWDTFLIGKSITSVLTGSVCFLSLQQLVVSAFDITKFCSVCFFHYKSL
jgi:hypothetical protein